MRGKFVARNQERAPFSESECDDFDAAAVDEGAAGSDPIRLCVERLAHQQFELVQTRLDEIDAGLQGGTQWRP